MPGNPQTWCREFICFPIVSQILLIALPASRKAAPTNSGPAIFDYEIVGEYPHDPQAFTQGLEFGRACGNEAGQCTEFFWESTGLRGRSTVRQVSFPNATVLRSRALPAEDFGEGLTRLGNR